MPNNNERIVRCDIKKSRKQADGETSYEGHIGFPNTTGTKLTQVRGQKTTYTSVRAVQQAAQAFANRWGLTLEWGDVPAEKPAAGRRAKQAVVA